MSSNYGQNLRNGEMTRFSSEYQPENRGRKPGSRTRAQVVKKWLEVAEEFRNPITKELEFLEQQDIITLRLIHAARNGDVSAFKELMDSAYGKALTNIELSGKGPLTPPPLNVYNTAPPMLNKEPEETNGITDAEIIPPDVGT